jgi:hypothetical protein
MFARARRFFTFANVVASLALFVALGTGTAYAANTVFSTDIVDGQVKTPDLADSAVTNVKIAPSAVGSGRILDGSIANVDIAAGAIQSNSVLDESLTSADLATDSVGPTEIIDNSIDTGEIVDNSIFAADLGPDSVGSSELQDNAVASANVLNNSLTTSDIAGAEVNGLISLSGIANGRCTQVTFAISGSLPGDVAIVTTRAAIQNGIVLSAARVASAGHVEVNACNFSGGAMTPISGFPVRVVTFR